MHGKFLRALSKGGCLFFWCDFKSYSLFQPQKSGWLHNVYSSKMLLLSFCDSLSMWVIIPPSALSDTTALLPLFCLVSSSYSSCSLFLFASHYTCPLPHFHLYLSSYPHYHLVHLFRAVIASDMTYIIALQPSVLWGQCAGIPEYFPASLRVNVFFPVPTVIGVSIYRS